MKFKLEELDEGSRFPCAVYADSGKRISDSGLVIDKDVKMKLLDWGIEKLVAVKEPLPEPISELREAEEDEFLVKNLAPPLVFDCPVYNQQGVKIVEPFVTIGDDQIRRLNRWSVKKLKAANSPLSSSDIENLKEQAENVEELMEEEMKEPEEPEEESEDEPETESPHYYKQADKDRVERIYRSSLEEFTDLLDRFSRSQLDKIDPFYELMKPLTKIVQNQSQLVLYLLAVDKISGEDYIYKHSLQTALLSVLIGNEMDMGDRELWRLGVGALIHDTGMLKIPQTIRKKSGRLNQEQRQKMKKHLLMGARVINGLKSCPADIQKVMLQHHERYDGSGYPSGLKGEQIHLHARIVNLTMTYVALNQPRPNRPEYGVRKSIRNVIYEHRERYDPEILDVFLSVMGVFPPGSVVRLTSGALAIVMESEPDNPLDPIVRVLKENHRRLEKPYRLFLKRSRHSIEGILNDDEHNYDVYELV